MSMNCDPKHMTKEQLQAVADKMYPGMALFARDVNLPEALARKYVPGQIIREKAFTDASSRFMGMVTSHRYVILSNHMKDLSPFEHGTNWGLHVAGKDARFKVLGLHTHAGKTGIFLLHLPDDESWQLWQRAEFSMDRQLYDMAVQRFADKCTQPPVPELTAKEWLDRCAFPLGMSDDGQLFPLEDGAERTEEKLSVKPCGPEPMKPLRPVGLMYTPLTIKAMQICFSAHKNQLDKSGLPYVFHPFHLAEQMETEHEVCAALLHDVVEDSNCTLEVLRQSGFPDEVVRAVRALTRDPHMHYLDYVARLRQDPIARRVKLADLKHNSDLGRLGHVSDQDRRRVLKYRMAQAILEDERYDEVLEQFRKVLPLSLDEPLFLSVFYDRQGVVQKYSIDIEKAEDSHYELDPGQAEKLRLALNPSRTLPEALADWAQGGGGCHLVGTMLMKYGIAFQPFHYCD